MILIGCEESQTLCSAFRRAGFEAYSCDLQPTRGNPEWHYQQDIFTVLPLRQWKLIILHPDCTAMALSGNRWYGKGMLMHSKRLEAIEWTANLWNTARQYAYKVALENPMSVIFKHLNAPVCWVHPWQHGHGEVKKTGFALHNLPPLMSSNVVDGRDPVVWKMPPSETRKRDRSKTYKGIADAIVKQWGIKLGEPNTTSE